MADASPRSSQRALRRRRVRRLVLSAASALVILWAFGAGYLWLKVRSGEPGRGAVPTEVADAQRAEALRLLDEGVRARFEERWQSALNAISAARLADPNLRGADTLIGEIALEQKNPETLRRAADRALKTGGNEAAAKLLKAVETWMMRGDKGVDQAGLLAGQYLSEAADDEPSSAAVRFFHGELSRMLGNGDEAHRHLRGALYRQAPWRSSALLEVKTQIAAREAADEGVSAAVGEPTAQAKAALVLLETVRSGGSMMSAREDLFVITPALQCSDLLDDAALAGTGNGDIGRKLREQTATSVPLLQAGGDAPR